MDATMKCSYNRQGQYYCIKSKESQNDTLWQYPSSARYMSYHYPLLNPLVDKPHNNNTFTKNSLIQCNDLTQRKILPHIQRHDIQSNSSNINKPIPYVNENGSIYRYIN